MYPNIIDIETGYIKFEKNNKIEIIVPKTHYLHYDDVVKFVREQLKNNNCLFSKHNSEASWKNCIKTLNNNKKDCKGCNDRFYLIDDEKNDKHNYRFTINY